MIATAGRRSTGRGAARHARRARPLRVAPLVGGLALLTVAAASAPPPPPGRPAPPAVRQEIQAVLDDAVRRFQAMDEPGVLAHISDQYRTGIFTKRVVREHLAAMFRLYETVQARVRIDDVRLVGDHAWVYSTGEVSGRFPVIGRWMTLLWWERELEVARREGNRWRLFGYQQ
jgi:hypothetical protein